MSKKRIHRSPTKTKFATRGPWIPTHDKSQQVEAESQFLSSRLVSYGLYATMNQTAHEIVTLRLALHELDPARAPLLDIR